MLSHFKTIMNMCLNVLITCHLPFHTLTCIYHRLFRKQTFYIIPVGDRLIGVRTIEKQTSGRPKDGCGCLTEDSRLIGVLFTVFYWQKFQNFYNCQLNIKKRVGHLMVWIYFRQCMAMMMGYYRLYLAHELYTSPPLSYMTVYILRHKTSVFLSILLTQ